MAKVKRSNLVHLLNITPDEDTPTWYRVGHGATDGTLAMNPQSVTEQDITQDNAESYITGYQPSLPISMKANPEDDAFNYVNELRRTRAVLGDCETQIIDVDMYDGDSKSGYKATKCDCVIQVDDYGGAASDPLSISFTINYSGDPVQGTFDPTTKTFTADE